MGAVVGAAVGDVDRDVAEEQHAALARRRRAARCHSRSKRTWSSSEPPWCEPVVDPVDVPRPELRRVGAGDGRVAVGDQRRRAGERRGRHVRRAGDPLGRPERQNLPPALPGGGEPVDETVGLVVEDPVRQRCRMQEDSGGAREVHAFRSGRRLRIVARVPLPKTTQPPARIQIQAIEPIVDCGRYAVKRTVGDRGRRLRDDLQGRPRHAGGCGAGARPRRAELGGGAAAAPSATTAGAGRSPSTAPAAGSSRSTAWTDRIATWQEEIRRKVGAGETELAGELSEGAVLLGRDVGHRRRGPRRRGGRPRRRRHLVAARGRRRPRARALRPWYELFPRSWGGFRGVADVLPQLAQLGFDVVYLPPVHPIGHTNRKGPNNTLTPGPGDPGSPWAIGAEEGGHDAIHPDLGTWDDFDAMVAAAKAAGIELALDFAVQCSPDHPWLKRASGVVLPPPRRDAEVRGEPAEEVPGHLQRQLRLRGLARPLAGAPRRRARLGRARDHGLPRRQPAHEADARSGSG